MERFSSTKSQLATPRMNGTCPALGHHFPCHLPQLRSPEEFEEATSCGQIQKVWGVCVWGGPALSRGGDFKFKTNTSLADLSSQVLNFMFCVVRPAQRGSNSIFLRLSLPGSFTGVQRWLRHKLCPHAKSLPTNHQH